MTVIILFCIKFEISYLIKGSVKINAHYFEDGNIQLKQSKNFDFVVKFGGDIQNEAKSIINNIKKSENDIRQGLEDMYESMSNNVVKPIRRPLPGISPSSLLEKI